MGQEGPILVTEGKEISGYRLVQSGNSVIVLTFCGNEIEEEIIGEKAGSGESP